jgi:hypothetical protein
MIFIHLKITDMELCVIVNYVLTKDVKHDV